MATYTSMATFGNAAAKRGNDHAHRIIAGDQIDADEEAMLTETLPAFERRLAGIYPDWPQFDAWRQERAAR